MDNDGMIPFKNLSCNYSSWFILLVIYNLPHEAQITYFHFNIFQYYSIILNILFFLKT